MSEDWKKGVEHCAKCRRIWYLRMGCPYKDPRNGKVVVRLCDECGRDPFYRKPKPTPDGEDLDEIFAILDEGIEQTGYKPVKNPNGRNGGQIWVNG